MARSEESSSALFTPVISGSVRRFQCSSTQVSNISQIPILSSVNTSFQTGAHGCCQMSVRFFSPDICKMSCLHRECPVASQERNS